MVATVVGERSLEYSPILTCFVVFSLIELMLVGFISIAMTLLAEPVSHICVPSTWYDKFTPYDIQLRPGTNVTTVPVVPGQKYSAWNGEGRRLIPAPLGGARNATCSQPGMERAITATGVHQLHIFIFLLVAVHVFYSCLTMCLALWKVHSWKKWEKEAQDTRTYIDDIAHRLTLQRKSTFQEYHTGCCCSTNTVFVWVVCFFQQIYIPRADYITLRQGFTTNHNLRDDYDFDAYMMRCMEDEFQKIVGISLKLWFFVLVFLLVNVHGVYLYFWSSFIPIILVLVIGTKLQYVVTTLAIENASVPAAFVAQSMKPRDELFWFGRPDLLLSILHLVMFQNAFELATFLWYVWDFGFHSCLLEQNKVMVYIRLGVGLAVQLFVSMRTLPLYTLVSQMGTNFKPAVLSTHVVHAVHNWHNNAKKRHKHNIFRFGHKKQQPDLEEQSLRPKGSMDSTNSPPMHVIMGDSSVPRGDSGQPSAKMSKGSELKPKDLHSLYVQVDQKQKNGNERGRL